SPSPKNTDRRASTAIRALDCQITITAAYTARKRLLYRMRIANPHRAPASTSKRAARELSSLDARSSHSNTHGTEAHRKMSVPAHWMVNSNGVRTPTRKPAHSQTTPRLNPSLKNGRASRAHPHQPIIVPAAASSFTAIPTLHPTANKPAASKE